MRSASLQKQLAALQKFSACDISDALLKLQKVPSGAAPRAGYLSDVVPFAPQSPFSHSDSPQPKIIAPASTLKLIDKWSSEPALPDGHSNALPKGSHWVDLTDEDTVVVIEQPSSHLCAAIGGIMAYRMKARGAVGCVVGGRVRDLAELKDSGLPVCMCIISLLHDWRCLGMGFGSLNSRRRCWNESSCSKCSSHDSRCRSSSSKILNSHISRNNLTYCREISYLLIRWKVL